MAESPDVGPVGVARLHRGHVALLLVVAVGLVLLLCAVGTLAALLVSDLIEISWRTSPADPGVGIALVRRFFGF